MTDDTQVREFLQQMADEIGGSPVDPRRPVHRARRHRSITTGLVAVLVAVIVMGGAIGLRTFTETAPATEPTPTQGPVPPGSRPVFQRTATIGGFTVTSPSDWSLVDYWGDYNEDDPTALDKPTALLEVTNFDAGLSTPVCETEPGQPSRLPSDGVAIFVTVGNDGGGVAGLCGGTVDATATGTVGDHPYRVVMALGPDVSAGDRATSQEIWRSIAPGALTAYARGNPHSYVVDASTGSATWLLEAVPTPRGVSLSMLTFDIGLGYDLVESGGVPDVRAIDGETFGFVTERAARVEYHRAGIATPFLATLIDLPPSLHIAADAFVVGSAPSGGPAETVAIGSNDEVLGSNFPPLVDTKQVGTVRAFGTTWNVMISRDAQGYLPATCVEPATTGSSQGPCERGWGGGLLVQSFDQPSPAAFVTQFVGVEGVDVVADDGRLFHAVMVPVRGGGSVAVVALEGGGSGRLIYHMTGGKTDEGLRPEAHIEWTEHGQVIGAGSFPPPGRA